MSKEQCLDAHYRGQSLRDTGKLAQARELFLKCAQSGCPALIQGDCSRFADEMTRTVPSITFVARDARGRDVVDTIVYVDDSQVADRLDQGKSIDVDPGEHTVRFLHKDKKVEQRVVVHQGERERMVIGTFHDLGADNAAGATPAASPTKDEAPEPDKPNRTLAPILLASAGGAVLITGGVLAAMGFSKVPSQCSYWGKDCAVADGDPALKEAKDGARLVNIGVIVGAVGLATVAGGVVWYIARSRQTEEPKKDAGFTPWFDHRSAGVSWKATF